MSPVMVSTMVPDTSLLPQTLPAARLTGQARPVPEWRAELRRIPNIRNAVTVVGALAQTFGLIALAARIDRPLVWGLTFVLMARGFALLAVLAHEAAHRLLFTNRRINDAVGKWLLAYPGFVPIDLYRRSHMAHHRDEMGPEEPDVALYAGYPIKPDSFRRKLTRDAVGISGWKNLKALFKALRSPNARPVALAIFGTQAVILGAFTLAGWPQLYFLLWLAPWMTGWRVINRLRSIAEHGGMIRSPDRRCTTHHVRQHALARFWMVPYNTGWHLAHHVDSGIPFRNLPRLHRELVAAGWVPAALEYPSYRSLWRALASG
jgi:fatty acid desaturase